MKWEIICDLVATHVETLVKHILEYIKNFLKKAWKTYLSESILSQIKSKL